jgi:hypothetical protein
MNTANKVVERTAKGLNTKGPFTLQRTTWYLVEKSTISSVNQVFMT